MMERYGVVDQNIKCCGTTTIPGKVLVVDDSPLTEHCATNRKRRETILINREHPKAPKLSKEKQSQSGGCDCFDRIDGNSFA